MALEHFKSKINKALFFSNGVQVLALSFAALLNGCIERFSPIADPNEIVRSDLGARRFGDKAMPGAQNLDYAIPDAQLPGAQNLDYSIPDAQLPGELDAQLPGELDAQLPEEPDAQLPEELDAQLPGELDAQLPEELDAQLPEELDAQLPGELDAQLPEELDAQLPEEPVCEVNITIAENSNFFLMEDGQLLFSFTVDPQGCDVSFHDMFLQLQNPDELGPPPDGNFADYFDFIRIIQETDLGVLDEDGLVVDRSNLIGGLYFDCLANESTVFHVVADLPWKDAGDFDYTTVNGEFSFLSLLLVFAESSFVEITTGEYPSALSINPADLSFADVPVKLTPMFEEPLVRGGSLDVDVQLNFWQQIREHLDNAQFMQIALHGLEFTYSTNNASLQSIVLVDEFGVDVEGQIVGQNIVFAFEDLNLLDGESLHLRVDYLPQDLDLLPSVRLNLVQGTYSVNGGLPIPLNHALRPDLDSVQLQVGF